MSDTHTHRRRRTANPALSAPALEASGYASLHAETGREALRLAANAAPDLVILDLGLPDMDGKEVLTKLRAFCAAPVIVLSAREREAEKIAALDLGADDYVEKPFAIGELLARLRAALRHARGGAAQRSVVEVDGLTSSTSTSASFYADGQPIKLTPREYDLLAALARNAGRVMTHGQILTAVWGPAHRDDVQYLRVFVGQLRAKIERDPTDAGADPHRDRRRLSLPRSRQLISVAVGRSAGFAIARRVGSFDRPGRASLVGRAPFDGRRRPLRTLVRANDAGAGGADMEADRAVGKLHARRGVLHIRRHRRLRGAGGQNGGDGGGRCATRDSR